ncbi:MAG TPA: hypothetical protein VFW02_04995, partial [Candidatus Limnocylindrales bacterium]|nr:hypothetical protein [Candidatus Limnocylindrales bacterium]
MSAIVAAITQPEEAVVPIDRGRMKRRRRELALDVAAGRMSERAFLAAMRRLNEEDAALVDPRPRRAADGAKAVEYVRNVAASWAKAKPPTRAAMIQSLYQEIVVRGEEFVSVRLTPRLMPTGSRSPLTRRSWFPASRPGAAHGAVQIWRWRARQ